MDAKQYLVSFNISIEDAANFVISNITNPKTIFDVSLQYGVTSFMLAEIYNHATKSSVSANDVKNFFTAHGLQGKFLDNSYFEVTEEWLSGKTLYNVYEADNDGFMNDRITFQFDTGKQGKMFIPCYDYSDEFQYDIYNNEIIIFGQDDYDTMYLKTYPSDSAPSNAITMMMNHHIESYAFTDLDSSETFIASINDDFELNLDESWFQGKTLYDPYQEDPVKPFVDITTLKFNALNTGLASDDVIGQKQFQWSVDNEGILTITIGTRTSYIHLLNFTDNHDAIRYVWSENYCDAKETFDYNYYNDLDNHNQYIHAGSFFLDINDANNFINEGHLIGP